MGVVADTRRMCDLTAATSGRMVKEKWKGAVMSSWIKKAAWLLVAAFLLFYLFTRPEQAAAAIKTFLGAFDAIVRFFTALAAR
jgi:hypothetical protein